MKRPINSQYYNWYVNALLEAWVCDIGSSLSGDVLVDVGCGVKPYAALFPGVSRYIGVDYPGMPEAGSAADVYGDAQRIPIAGACADVVLCTEVLEHLPQPALAVAEMHRILKPGGSVIVTVPFIWHVHDAPHDYWRFTEFGLRHLFESSGFTIESLRPINGFVGAMLQESCYLALSVLGRLGAARPVVWLVQHLAAFLGRWDRNARVTNNYVLHARKNR